MTDKDKKLAKKIAQHYSPKYYKALTQFCIDQLIGLEPKVKIYWDNNNSDIRVEQIDE